MEMGGGGISEKFLNLNTMPVLGFENNGKYQYPSNSTNRNLYFLSLLNYIEKHVTTSKMSNRINKQGTSLTISAFL